MEFNKNLKVYKKLQGFTRVYYSKRYGNSKEIKYSLKMFVYCCQYTSITWIQNVYHVKISLCSTYVNEIWMKYLKNYLSGDYDCIGQYDCRVKFCFIEYLIICLMQPKKEMIHIQP